MKYGILLALFFLPSLSHAEVTINEIAWMGTIVGANEEWIELLNSGSEDIDVNGWILSDTGSLSITLTGIIPAHGLVLLERTDDDSVPGVAAFLIYTGALTNTGATLTLRDQNSAVIDQVVGGEGWINIGGDNVTKDTPQRMTSGWKTGTPTPGAQNSATQDPEDENSTDEDTTDEIEREVRSSGSSVKSSTKLSLVKAPSELSLTFSLPETAYVNQPIKFEGIAAGVGPTIVNSLIYSWNFGDTYTALGKTASHAFKYPGEYIVVLNAAYARHDTTIQKVLHVLPVTLSISRSLKGDVVIENKADHNIDLSGYTLSGVKTFIFPPRTFLLKGGKITLDPIRIGMMGEAILKDTTGMIVAREIMPAVTTHNPRPMARSESVSRTTPVSTAEPQTLPMSDIQKDNPGSVLGASTTLPVLTIPVYAAEGGKESDAPTQGSSWIPYVGLIGILFAGILLLYRRHD